MLGGEREQKKKNAGAITPGIPGTREFSSPGVAGTEVRFSVMAVVPATAGFLN